MIGTPTPKKLSVASIDIEWAVCKVPKTTNGDTLFGRTCLKIIRKLFRPSIFAYSKYSFFISTLAVALIVRA